MRAQATMHNCSASILPLGLIKLGHWTGKIILPARTVFVRLQRTAELAVPDYFSPSTQYSLEEGYLPCYHRITGDCPLSDGISRFCVFMNCVTGALTSMLCLLRGYRRGCGFDVNSKGTSMAMTLFSEWLVVARDKGSRCLRGSHAA